PLGPTLIAILPPSLINLPHKDYWLAPERRERTIARFSASMEWFGVALVLFLGFVYELVFIANTTGNGRLANGPFVFALAAFALFAVFWMPALFRAFRLPKR